jgi:hypothetical protein
MTESQNNVKNYRYFSGGQWKDAEGGKTFEVHEPYTGKGIPGLGRIHASRKSQSILEGI